MPTQLLNTEILRNGFIEPKRPGEKVWISSKKVAELCDRRHDNVLRDIRHIQKQVPDFFLLNFEFLETIEKSSGGAVVNLSEYRMTRDGFFMLSMGFTGESAMKFKELIIARFNVLERYYLEREGANRRSFDKLNRLTVDSMLRAGKTRLQIKRELVPTPQERDQDAVKELTEIFHLDKEIKQWGT